MVQIETPEQLAYTDRMTDCSTIYDLVQGNEHSRWLERLSGARQLKLEGSRLIQADGAPKTNLCDGHKNAQIAVSETGRLRLGEKARCVISRQLSNWFVNSCKDGVWMALKATGDMGMF